MRASKLAALIVWVIGRQALIDVWLCVDLRMVRVSVDRLWCRGKVRKHSIFMMDLGLFRITGFNLAVFVFLSRWLLLYLYLLSLVPASPRLYPTTVHDNQTQKSDKETGKHIDKNPRKLAATAALRGIWCAWYDIGYVRGDRCVFAYECGEGLGSRWGGRRHVYGGCGCDGCQYWEMHWCCSVTLD